MLGLQTRPPWYRFDTHNASQPMTFPDGTPLTAALVPVPSQTKPLCTKANEPGSIPLADPVVVGLLGCGAMAGIGAAMNTGNVQRGDFVAGRPEIWRQAFYSRASAISP